MSHLQHSFSTQTGGLNADRQMDGMEPEPSKKVLVPGLKETSTQGPDLCVKASHTSTSAACKRLRQLLLFPRFSWFIGDRPNPYLTLVTAGYTSATSIASLLRFRWFIGGPGLYLRLDNHALVTAGYTSVDGCEVQHHTLLRFRWFIGGRLTLT
jgi:hypothetical protein